MPIDLGSLELYAGPPGAGAPDDLEAVIVAFIDDARDRLRIAVQELESEPITRAITRARARGVHVQIMLEADYLESSIPVTDPFAPGGRHEENRRLAAALLRAQVELRIDLNGSIFHQKFIVRDPEGTRAAVLTGSTNFTPTGVAENLNHVVILRSRRAAEIYDDEFDEIWTGTFGSSRLRHDPEPRHFDLSHVRLKPLFAPDHSPEMEIMKQMLKARSRIDFAVFTFSNTTTGIDDAMIAQQRAGVAVRGVLDRRNGNQQWAASHDLAANGVTVHISRAINGARTLHHKLMVLDDQVVIAGSFNYTGPANRLNDENIVVIGDLEEADPTAIQNQTRVGTYMRREIDRIIARHAGPPL
jgi:phosphatidylserine/phosphatidylglycerophosphate/cardiolipin synthase-like enzyme